MSIQQKKTQTTTVFDIKFYETLEIENRVIVKQKTAEIKSHLQYTAQNIWEIGQRLANVRSRLKWGQFDLWLKFEFGWSRRTAYNFINVYETFRDCANFAQLDIPMSALYLLSAPSTPQKIRSEFLEQAMAGKKVTLKGLRRAIKGVDIQLASTSVPVDSSESTCLKPQLGTTAPKREFEDKTPVFEHIQSEPCPASPTIITYTSSIQPGWHLLDNRHLLFCGDTGSAQFMKYVPQAAFALAIPSGNWCYDWLIKTARTALILQEMALEEGLIERLLSMFSEPNDAVIFPHLSSWKLLGIAHRLERNIYAGASDPERCTEVIRKLGLKVDRVAPVGK